MRLNRMTVGALAAGVILLPAPTAALASPLLSGYGGPGTGTQQIISAGLVGGEGGGAAGNQEREAGGGHSGEAVVSGGGAQGEHARGKGASHASHAPAPGGAADGGGGSSGAPRTGASGTLDGSSGGSRKAAASPRSTAPQVPAAAQAAATQPVTLGLSSGQLLMVALIAAALVLTALLTLWLGALQRRDEAADTEHMRSPSR